MLEHEASIGRLRQRLADGRDVLIERVMEERLTVTGYATLDPDQVDDLRQSVGMIADTFVRLLAAGGEVTHDDVAFLRAHVRRRVIGGVSQENILTGLRMVQRTLWEGVVEFSREDEHGHAAALELARPLLDYLDAMSIVCAEAFNDIASALASSGSIVRSELLDELLAGREPAPGPALNAMRACGLDRGSLVVVIARSLDPLTDEAVLPLVVTRLARAAGDALEPLGVIRDDQAIVVRATPPEDARRFAEAIGAACDKLAGDGTRLAVGISAVHGGVRVVADAYQEASVALEHAPADGGVVALPLMEPLDYVILRASDETAWRMVPPRIRSFLEDDAEADLLTGALLAFVQCDMNVKLAAERLCVHTNTAHYRLGKLQDRTGCHVRRLEDLSQLIVAIRIHQALAARGA
ncbi:hypothetical protein DSM112329_03690 [Paraconexibacter sp. AEG42_29]|uniref:PucR family transcriptional regulator n=1 Tax=Paraconexibacter sp. AEG42_29 TaxID=2997339 RepID=A0AAU7AYV1_9ACTN